MMSRGKSIEQWRDVQRQLATFGGTLTIPKSARFSHPRDAGAYQIADYVLALEAGFAPLLIREFTDRFEVFSDALQLTARIVRMVETNPALATYVGAA
jgi:hypothetical protein